MVDPVSTQDAVQGPSSHPRCLPMAGNPRNTAEGRTTNQRSFAFCCAPVVQGVGDGCVIAGVCVRCPYPQPAQQLPLSATFPILFNLRRIKSMEHMRGCHFPVEGRSHFWVADSAEPCLLLPGSPGMCRKGNWQSIASAFPMMGTMGFSQSTPDTVCLTRFLHTAFLICDMPSDEKGFLIISKAQIHSGKQACEPLETVIWHILTLLRILSAYPDNASSLPSALDRSHKIQSKPDQERQYSSQGQPKVWL